MLRRTLAVALFCILGLSTCAKDAPVEPHNEYEQPRFGAGRFLPQGPQFHEEPYKVTFTWPAIAYSDTIDRIEVYIWEGTNVPGIIDSRPPLPKRVVSVASKVAPTSQSYSVDELSLAYDWNYVWQVRAVAKFGAVETDSWSNVYGFDIANRPPYTPNYPLAPTNYNVGEVTSVTLSWPAWKELDKDRIEKYELYLTSNGEWTKVYEGPATSHVVSVTPKTDYSWRVDATDEHGLTNRGNTWMFGTHN